MIFVVNLVQILNKNVKKIYISRDGKDQDYLPIPGISYK